MTEEQKRYKKEHQKQICINLKISDYKRWSAAASIRSLPLATYIRQQIESDIRDTENDQDCSITDILEYQESLKN